MGFNKTRREYEIFTWEAIPSCHDIQIMNASDGVFYAGAWASMHIGDTI